jgi:multisubunit Na+/H+ antiporter MnhF subunit
MILLEAIRSGRSLFMDIALCMAILLFLTTVAFALYYKKGGHP